MIGKLYTAEEIRAAIKRANIETIDGQPNNRHAATAALVLGEFIEILTEDLKIKIV